MSESGRLTGIGVDCIWRVLEVHGTSPLNHLCRLVANAGLPHRLMRAMLTCNQEYHLLLTHAEVCLGAPCCLAITQLATESCVNACSIRQASQMQVAGCCTFSACLHQLADRDCTQQSLHAVYNLCQETEVS